MVQEIVQRMGEQLNLLQSLKPLTEWVKGVRGGRRRSLPLLPMVEEPESVELKGESVERGGPAGRQGDSRVTGATRALGAAPGLGV